MSRPAAPKRLGVFERYLSVWVALCIVTQSGDTARAFAIWEVVQ